MSAKLHFGAAYYPEHWPEERWAEDIRLMREAGLTVVRMAEFAWSTLEPAAAQFDFGWLERAVEKLAAVEIGSVLSTPTAAPPAWLVEQDPDLLAVDESGRRVQFGNRCHYCVTSSALHAATRRIVAAMAARFGANPSIIGWQLDNEYNRVCYCERCRRLFQQFLAQKYGALTALNERWSTAYWSQTYSAWEQIPIPIGPHNPGLMLEFKHFVTACYRQFQRLQIDLLRPHLAPGVWITHNFMKWYGGYDHYDLAADLDLASWDWYVPTGHHDHLASGAAHDLVRGYKRRNFWLMETQPGNVNWVPVNNATDKGEAVAMAWHAIAHGADAILYWQWRSALGGQEQYHGTLVDQSGRPRPFYAEAQLLGGQIQSVSELLAGSKVSARVALLNAYDSRWAIELQRHHADFDYVAHLSHYYRARAASNVAVDIISADEPLDGYRLVIAPALTILNDKRVANLTEFVERGGHLVLTVRTGMKDASNALLPMRQPGPLAALAGVEVEEYYALDAPVPVEGRLLNGSSKLWAERLRVLDPDQVIPMAQYGKSNGWLDGEVAIAVHPYGKGMGYTVGAYLDDQAQRTLMNHVLQMAGISGFETPDGVEIAARITPQGKMVYFAINHTREAHVLSLPWPAFDHLSMRTVRDLCFEPYSVAILTRGDTEAA